MLTLSTPRSRRALRLKLRALRVAHELSQLQCVNDFRRKTHVPMNGTRWCNLENGSIEATLEERNAIERFFKVPPGTIPWVAVPRLMRRRIPA